MDISCKVFSTILDIAPGDWNPLTLDIAHPFFTWSWLASLEESGSIGPQTGWDPRIITLWTSDESGSVLVAALPFYRRDTSWGELFFDFGWYDIARRLGSPYVPKLVATVPATPVKGLGVLTRGDVIEQGSEDEVTVWHTLVDQAEEIVAEERLAQIAFLFLDDRFAAFLRDRGYHLWGHHQFIWKNRNYPDFDSYVEQVFRKNQRRNIRRECRVNRESGFSFRAIPGDEAPPEAWQSMYRFYDRTNTQFGPMAARFLTPRFFSILGGYKPGYISLLAAYGDSPRGASSGGAAPGREWKADPEAMAFLGDSGRGLFGRYWGTETDRGFLHFNLCYYQPQAWAIERGMEFFDPGVGSMHKVRRGFESRMVYSAHRFSDPDMSNLWSRVIPELNRETRIAIQGLNAQMPIRREAGEAGFGYPGNPDQSSDREGPREKGAD